MWRNKSFIFFRELADKSDGTGPIGAQGIALVGGRSLAVDRRHYRLGLPIYLSVPHFRKGDKKNLRRLMIAQDTGNGDQGSASVVIFSGDQGKRLAILPGVPITKASFMSCCPATSRWPLVAMWRESAWLRKSASREWSICACR